MTAHELARKLLEGPDFYVVVERDTDYGSATELCVVDTIERIPVWQVDYGTGWSADLLQEKPRNEKLKVREGEVVRIR